MFTMTKNKPITRLGYPCFGSTTPVSYMSPDPFEDHVAWQTMTSGLQIGDFPDGVVRCSTELVSTEVKQPRSNICTHFEQGSIITLPSLTFLDTHLRVSYDADSEGWYFKDWYLDYNLKSITGFPNRFEVIRTEPEHRDIGSSAVDVLSARGDQELAGLSGLVLQLLELKDMPQMVRSAIDFIRFLRTAVRGLSGAFSIKGLASSYLAVQYGVIPTIGQVEYFINTLPEAIKQVKSRMQQLRELASDQSLVSVRKNIGIPYELPTIEFDPWRPITLRRSYSVTDGWIGRPHDQQLLGYVTQHGRSYTTAKCSRDIVYAQFRAAAIRRASGDAVLWSAIYDILKPFENIWAITSLSFVVNWFVDIDRIMANLDGFVQIASLEKAGVYAIDGAWRARRWDLYYGHNLPSNANLDVVVTPEPLIRPTTLHIDQTYSFPQTTQSVWQKATGRMFKRAPIELSLVDLLLPKINIDLNLSKAVSLLAIGLGFTRS